MASRSRFPRAAPPSAHDLNPRRDPPLDFPERDLGELGSADYRTLGLLCGLEVHQQLSTAGKLFCRCPAGRRVERVDAEVLRHMRPTLSELGEYDGCALMEFKTHKEIVYLLERGSVCTYEMDDTPPFEIDREAVAVALEIALRFGLKLCDELQVMRKQYLDGSIPTGFQRTAMVGLDGVIPFRTSELSPGRELRIRQLTLEEDSCREVSDVGHRIVFRTDRLGTPLVEAVTEPDLLTPLDAARGGRLLAEVVRSSGKVRRGVGAARQDVNVSVAGGRRVEIKGVDSLRLVPRLVHVEAFRQLALLRIRAELERRGVTREMLAIDPAGEPWENDQCVDARPIVRRTDFAPIADAIGRGEMVCAVRLPGFAGLLEQRTQPGVTFAAELGERVRVIACPVARPFMLGSHLHDYGLRSTHWRQLRQALSASADDAVVVLWAPPDDAATAAREGLERAAQALDGVPSETRQWRRDGTTGFERILPGPQRMYPDTDTPPVAVPEELVLTVQARLGERPWERADRYLEMGLAPVAAARLATAPWADLFDGLAPARTPTARRLASALERRLVHHWRRQHAGRELPEGARLQPLVDAADAGTLRLEAFDAVFDRLLGEPERDAVGILADYRPGPDDGTLERIGRELRRSRAELQSADPDARLRWAMGRAMPSLLGRLDLATIRAALERAIEPEPVAFATEVRP